MEAGASGTEDRFAGVAPAELRVRLFGELALEHGDRPIGPIESARARSLLGYLVLHRDAPQPRPRVAFLLWPDSTEAQARTNLRKVLHTLRRDTPELEPFLAITAQTVQWVATGPSEVDVEVFESALARSGDGNAAADVAAFREALDRYTGDLLEGCYDEWLIEVRERLRDRYVAALARLGRMLSEHGDHVEAVRRARELVRCEPLREASHRLLMSVYEAAGDRAAAVRAYHECASTLRRELGVEPSAETAAAYAALARADPVADDGPVAAHPAGLVARDAEWNRLTRVWRDATSSGPQMVVVTGEPGVGKTRLVEEFAAWCAHQGAVVASARSYPTEGELGLGLAVSWLRDGMPEGVRRASPADRAELARLMPELERGTDGPPSPTDDAERRRRLFDAIARVVVGQGRPVVLLADDAQWSDTQSLQLLHYLLRFDGTGPLLAVATVRREDLARSHPLHELLDGIAVADRLTQIALERLSEAETAALARELVGDDVADEAITGLFDDTEGNPLFIVESVRAGWPATGGGSSLSPRLQAVVTARLRRLTPATRDLLGVAATVGRDFTVGLLREASTIDEMALAVALDEVWRRGLVREHGADGYDFSHGRIRDVVYDELAPAVRRRNHVVIASALQRLHGPAAGPVSGQIAVHFDLGGRPDDAIGWYRRAAVEAQRRSANPEAVRLLDRALQLVAGLPDDDRLQSELEVLSGLPTPLAGMEGFASERLVVTQQRVVQLAQLLGASPEPQVLRSVVMSRLCRDEFDEAVVVAGQLRDQADRGGDDGLLVESTYLLGIGAFWGGHLEAARSHFVDVVARFEPEQRPQHLLRFGHDPRIVCLSRLGNTLRFLGDPDGARRASDEAVTMADGVGHPFSRGVALIFATLLAIDLDDKDRVGALVDGLRRDPHPARPNDIKTDALGGYAEIVAGNPTAGLEQLRRAIDRSGLVNHAPGFAAALLRVLVAGERLAGHPDAGLAAADQALGLGGTRLWEADIRMARAEFLEARGEPAAAVDAEVDRALAVARSQGAAGPARLIEDRWRQRRPAG